MLRGTIFTDPKRLVTHFTLAAITIAGCYLTILLKPDFKLARQLTVGLGYVALLFVIFTLIYGPWKLLTRKNNRKNPVNFYLRRDVGIWAAITGLLHVWYGFQIHLGGRILAYFFEPHGQSLRPRFSAFGLTNYIGLLGTLVLILLLLLSNDLSLRWLRSKRWKFLQNFNYGLIVLVVVHTVMYQLVVNREIILQVLVVILSLVVLIVQLAGFIVYRSRRT